MGRKKSKSKIPAPPPIQPLEEINLKETSMADSNMLKEAEDRKFTMQDTQITTPQQNKSTLMSSANPNLDQSEQGKTMMGTASKKKKKGEIAESPSTMIGY